MSFCSSFLAALICETAISYCVLVLDEPLSLEPAAKASNDNIKDKNIEASFALLGYSEPSLIYRLGSNTKVLTSNKEAINFIIKNKFKYLIIEDAYLDEFKIMANQNQLSIKIIDKNLMGFNYSNGKSINITIINII